METWVVLIRGTRVSISTFSIGRPWYRMACFCGLPVPPTCPHGRQCARIFKEE